MNTGLHSFTPYKHAAKAAAPIYFLAAPTTIYTTRLRSATAAHGLRWHDQAKFFSSARAYLMQVVPPNTSGFAELLNLISRVEAHQSYDDGESANADLARWAALRDMLTRQSPEVKRMAIDNDHYLKMAPMVTASVFVVGWQNVGIEFQHQEDGTVAFDLIARLTEEDRFSIWFKVLDLINGVGKRAA